MFKSMSVLLHIDCLMKRNADVNKYCFILLDSYELIDCIVLYLIV